MKAICTALGVIAALACATAYGETLEEVEQRIVKAWDEIDTVRCRLDLKLRLSLESGPVPAEGTGIFEGSWRDGVNRARAHAEGVLRAPLGDLEVPIPQDILAVLDGESVHIQTMLLRMPVVMSKNVAKEEVLAKRPARALFAALHENGKVRLLDSETVGEQPVDVIEAKLKKPDADALLPAAKLRFHFRRKDAMLVMVRAFDNKDQEIGTATFRSFTLNSEIPVDRFAYRAPENAQQLDLSKAESALVPSL